MENGTPLYFCFFIITSAIGTINSALFFVWLLEPRWKWWKTAGILFLSFFVPTMILLPLREIILVKSPVLLAVTVAAVAFCFKDKFWQKALCVTIYLVSGLIIEMGGSTVCNLVIGKPVCLGIYFGRRLVILYFYQCLYSADCLCYYHTSIPEAEF